MWCQYAYESRFICFDFENTVLVLKIPITCLIFAKSLNMFHKLFVWIWPLCIVGTIIASRTGLQMEIPSMLSPPFLWENLLEPFYPMSVLLALEPFYLDTILGMNILFMLAYHYLHKSIWVIGMMIWATSVCLKFLSIWHVLNLM